MARADTTKESDRRKQKRLDWIGLMTLPCQNTAVVACTVDCFSRCVINNRPNSTFVSYSALYLFKYLQVARILSLTLIILHSYLLSILGLQTTVDIRTDKHIVYFQSSFPPLKVSLAFPGTRTASRSTASRCGIATAKASDGTTLPAPSRPSSSAKSPSERNQNSSFTC